MQPLRKLALPARIGDGLGVNVEGLGPEVFDAANDLLIVIPVYNDWESAAELLRRLAVEIRDLGVSAQVLLIDDGSTSSPPAELLERFPSVTILLLRHNLGNQRAIAIGLAYAQAERTESIILVMDGDGEDDPADVSRLIAKFRQDGAWRFVFAERRRRSESVVFVFFYHLYRAVHLLLTGQAVRVGNFSVFPRVLLNRIVIVPELWNHYAAAVYCSRLPRTSIPTRRAPRISGRSKLTFTALVVHGLSAISVYREVVAVRVLCATMVVGGIALTALTGLVGLRLWASQAVAGWVTFTAGLLVVVLAQAAFISLLLVLMMLGGRQVYTFLPLRDYAYFISGVIRGSASRDVA